MDTPDHLAITDAELEKFLGAADSTPVKQQRVLDLVGRTEEIYMNAIWGAQFDLDLLPEARVHRSRLADEELAADTFRNLDYLAAVEAQVIQPFREFEATLQDQSLGRHLAARGVKVIRFVGPERPAKLVPTPGFGFGIDVANPTKEGVAEFATLLNATFFFDRSCSTTIPDSDLKFVVFPDRTMVSRQDFEILWCWKNTAALQEHDQAVDDLDKLFTDLPETPLVFVRDNGDFYAA